ncbi:MAG: bifunctional N(6)-L-threonylcarbamoyladenine synthase/serine/threonine protein kinase [Nitrososphaerota archaeon]|nr:bifunctional N(6)-L-threonylcarbamoyladenine synthase/serine/threonine protein kinase [Candidatus Aenigmarchaeota archaeon]
MLCLGIESTAHTFGIGIVDEKGNILSNEKDVYKPKVGGIHPKECTEHHLNVANDVLKKSLETAKINLNDIDIISFSQGPGIPGVLRIGAVFSRALALKLKKPLFGVNHCIAHIEIGKLLTHSIDPVTLYVSGGNTQVIAFTEGKYRIFGETQDIGIGNALDKLARELGFEHPGGPKIEEYAKSGNYINFSYVVKGMDLSFSGILTEAKKKIKNHSINDICYSFQETCFAMLTEVTERAVAHTDKNEVLLTGGVAANKRLQEMLSIMCKERGAKFYVVPQEFAGDNGAMIAWTGMLMYKYNPHGMKIYETKINRFWRTDEVDIPWIS